MIKVSVVYPSGFNDPVSSGGRLGCIMVFQRRVSWMFVLR